MIQRGTLTKFIVQDGDYFTGLTDQNCVRIGIVGGTCYDIPKGHAWYDRVVGAFLRVDVEDLHDQLTSAYA